MDETPDNAASFRPKAKLSRAWKVLIVVAILFIGIPVGFIVSLGIAFDHKFNQTLQTADAGFARAKQTINPEDLRSWALKEISQYPITNQTDDAREIPSEEVPGYLRDLYTQPLEDAWVEKSGDQTYVQVFWGGALFHWMFYVGATNLVPSANSEVKTAEWVPGIYYGREDTRHPIK